MTTCWPALSRFSASMRLRIALAGAIGMAGGLLWWTMETHVPVIEATTTALQEVYDLEQEMAVLEKRWSDSQQASLTTQLQQAEQRLVRDVEHLGRWIERLRGSAMRNGFTLEYQLGEIRSLAPASEDRAPDEFDLPSDDVGIPPPGEPDAVADPDGTTAPDSEPQEPLDSSSDALGDIGVLPVIVTLRPLRGEFSFGDGIKFLRAMVEEKVRMDIHHLTVQGTGQGAKAMEIGLDLWIEKDGWELDEPQAPSGLSSEGFSSADSP